MSKAPENRAISKLLRFLQVVRIAFALRRTIVGGEFLTSDLLELVCHIIHLLLESLHI